MGGHVFIVHSDLTKLACDAWLLPSDHGLTVGQGWTGQLSAAARARLGLLQQDPTQRSTAWRGEGGRVIPLEDDTESREGPRAYVVDVGGWEETPIGWYVEGLRQFFLLVASHETRWRQLPAGRKPLIALPVVGTGQGGAQDAKGSVVRAVIGAIHDAAEVHDVDVALVTKDRPMFVAAQNARRRHLRERGPADAPGWPDLSPGLVAEARRLAAHAVSGRLVLFLGAGVSRAAGLPNWHELLERLAFEAQMTQLELKALSGLHELDRARIVQHRLAAQGRAIGDVVADMLVTPRFSLAHALLASLPVGEAVTTNYDDLFEAASTASGRDTAVLPYQSLVGRTRWLLKLHGSVSHPADIVLTREDYLRYADRRAALGAIVQAMLITRHMLFVGFSLTDDNFHRIIDEVRKAINGAGALTADVPVFGSVLKLDKDDLWNELWRNDLDIISLREPDDRDRDAAARRLDIFLDLVLAEASHESSPLLDPAFEGVLTEDEREIATLLNQLTASASDRVRESPAWVPVAQLLHSLGQQEARSMPGSTRSRRRSTR